MTTLVTAQIDASVSVLHRHGIGSPDAPGLIREIFEAIVANAPAPDNTLPTPPAGIDNELPTPPAGVDNELPGAPVSPDNTLPGAPPGEIDNTLPPGVDNTLPGAPASPDNTLPEEGAEIDNTLPEEECPDDHVPDHVSHPKHAEPKGKKRY